MTNPAIFLPEPERVLGIPKDDHAQAYEFCRLVGEGHGRMTAALMVKWSPGKAIRYLDDSGFLELVTMAEGLLTESFEQVLYEKALAGHQRALEMVLYNRMPHKWRDRTSSNQPTVKVDVNIAAGVKDGILEVIRSRGVSGLQPSRAIEATASDAETG